MKKRILIVDDDISMRKLTTTLLWNCESILITEADNGRTALELIRGGSFDLIVCDIDMPIMNGVELRNAIEDLGIKTPFLFVSGHTDESTLDYIREKGKVVSKPFDFSHLRSVIFELLGLTQSSLKQDDAA